MHRNRRAFSRGQGEPDGPGYDMAGPVWGADGPAPVYRRSALLAARLPASHGGWGVLDEDVLRDLPWIAAREVMLLGFMLVADPRRLSAITATLRLTRAALHKRHWLKHAERQWRGG